MNPIPRDADPADSLWEREFLELAHGLVMAGAKTRLIARYTGLPLRRIRVLYRTLRGVAAPSGPIAQGSARFFALRSRHTSAAWNIQCAAFLGCYERIGSLTEQPLHRGWQLLAAFNAYLAITDSLTKSAAVKQLDINQCFALLTRCGFLQDPRAELGRRECPSCLISYLVVASLPASAQPCPVCSMSNNARRLAAQAAAAAQSRTRHSR